MSKKSSMIHHYDRHVQEGKFTPASQQRCDKARKVNVKGDTTGAVFAPISYENPLAVVPPSPAGNEALLTPRRKWEGWKQLELFPI